MANYAISGVWKDNNNVITHYAFHNFDDNGSTIGLATKRTKAEAIRLLDISGNSSITILWNYTNPGWKRGSIITVVGTALNRYLRTNHDDTTRDNLGHLIDYGLVTNNFA